MMEFVAGIAVGINLVGAFVAWTYDRIGQLMIHLGLVALVSMMILT